MKKRWIQMDVTRGVGILIIVFGHSWFVASSPTVLYPLLSPFILPLFFFISGVFFRTEQPFGEMALRKADALLKPFFVTMLGYVILRDLLRGQPLLPDIGGVLYASVDTLPWQALWYLPHFWVATLFAWFMLRVIQRLGLSLAASCVLLAVQLGLGILFLKTFWQIPVEFGGEQYLLPGLPFSLDITLISSAHFMFGYVLRDVLRRHQSSLLTLCIALAVTTASFLYYPTVVDMAQRRYDHWFWATVQAVSGVYLCWALSGLMMKIDWLGKAMTYIGHVDPDPADLPRRDPAQDLQPAGPPGPVGTGRCQRRPGDLGDRLAADRRSDQARRAAARPLLPLPGAQEGRRGPGRRRSALTPSARCACAGPFPSRLPFP